MELDLFQVVREPNGLSKYRLLYKDGMATGMTYVYGYDEDWYYLNKGDMELSRVKRRKDLEGIPPPFTYPVKGRQRRRKEQPERTQPAKKTAIQYDQEQVQRQQVASPSSEEPEQCPGLKMGGM